MFEMPSMELSDDKLAKAMARLDSIQHPKGMVPSYARPPLPPHLETKTGNGQTPNVDKLPELNSKAINNYKVLKGRVETPTSKLVSKYWSQNNDRFANLSRLSAETAPGALQTVPESPSQSRGTSPDTQLKESHSASKRRELAIFRTSKQLKNGSNRRNKNDMYNSFNSAGVNKFQMLRSKSFANDIHEEENEDEENNNTKHPGMVKLTMHDLNEFSQKALQHERTSQHNLSPLKTTLYNSFVDVKKFRKFVKDPQPPAPYIHDYVERKYFNYCDEEKTLRIQEWLTEVNKVHKQEGYWTEIIDRSLIRQQIPKHSSAEMKEMKVVNSNGLYSNAHSISSKLSRLKADEATC